jgi:peptidyl-prolyl cis-trans isomerase C
MESCRRYYDANAGRFRAGDVFECAHILIAARRAESATSPRHANAPGLLLHLRERPGDFAKLASKPFRLPITRGGGPARAGDAGHDNARVRKGIGRLAPGKISPAVVPGYRCRRCIHSANGFLATRMA